jgi:hypothetical protein
MLGFNVWGFFFLIYCDPVLIDSNPNYFLLFMRRSLPGAPTPRGTQRIWCGGKVSPASLFLGLGLGYLN